ncbi:spore coat associated protein CotJA [Blautia faecicola]|uniref:Spore coat associated protein CotJA n=2 Tax=Lachnospiraceae TaxID=186803 RepID=A0A4Q1RLU5_9FIRM|nr:spore coat associated protein CotJA [Blautia faecicola]
MLPLAMAYVPMQKFGKVYEPARGFQLGTIFPELCKPFCGKGGECRR